MDMTREKLLNEIREWFVTHQDYLLHIKKEEDGDVDRIQLDLASVDLVPHKDYDHYLSSQAFLLNGAGSTLSDEGPVPLPYDFFEIALTDWWSVEIEGHLLRLETERGTYTIEAKNRS